jgi:hypothetical protein
VIDTYTEYRHAGAEETARVGIGLVNLKHPFIFNGVFEIQKSTRNGKNNAEMRALGTWGPRLYYVRIHHNGRLRGNNLPLTRRTELELEGEPLEAAPANSTLGHLRRFDAPRECRSVLPK